MNLQVIVAFLLLGFDHRRTLRWVCHGIGIEGGA